MAVPQSEQSGLPDDSGAGISGAGISGAGGPEPDPASSSSEANRPVHELAGVAGYGKVPHDPDEPPFHHDWERRVFAMMSPLTRKTSVGEFRYALERLDETDYFKHGYYGRWLAGLELLLTEKGMLAPGELDERLAAPGGSSPAHRAQPIAAVLPEHLPAEPGGSSSGKGSGKVGTARRTLDREPQFSIGDKVVAIAAATPGHTRQAGYIVNRRGTVVAYHGVEVLPDSTAHGLGERPQHIYAVGFEAVELWGETAEAGFTVHIDLYECYLKRDPA